MPLDLIGENLMITGQTVNLQHLRTMKMTPQLRQAIGLLHFNNRALSAFLAIKASSNPYLKIVTVSNPPTSGADPGVEFGRGLPSTQRDPPGALVGQNFAASNWNEVEDSVASSAAGLYEHVRRQIDMSIRDPRQKAIAYFLTESLDPSGWLGRPLAKIAQEAGCSLKEAESVLHALQGFEPTGIFARSLSECLRLQATEDGILSDTLALVLDHLEMVGQGEIDRLAKLGKTTAEAILIEVKVIRRLNPKPGATFDSTPHIVRPPDLVARLVNGNWQVELNRSNLPALLVREDISPDDLDSVAAEQKDKLLAEAYWLERAVARRNVTTLTVAAEIVRRQTSFLVDGPSCLVPMSLADVANAAQVHGSTVSRVTSGLMMATPRGAVTLRDFFSVGLQSEKSPNGVSATAVRNKIRRMIESEDVDSPISDEALTAHLRDQGIQIARRTVAKYREMEGLHGSAARKRRGRLVKNRGAT